jgi:hypothetical protein
MGRVHRGDSRDRFFRLAAEEGQLALLLASLREIAAIGILARGRSRGGLVLLLLLRLWLGFSRDGREVAAVRILAIVANGQGRRRFIEGPSTASGIGYVTTIRLVTRLRAIRLARLA